MKSILESDNTVTIKLDNNAPSSTTPSEPANTSNGRGSDTTISLNTKDKATFLVKNKAGQIRKEKEESEITLAHELIHAEKQVLGSEEGGISQFDALYKDAQKQDVFIDPEEARAVGLDAFSSTDKNKKVSPGFSVKGSGVTENEIRSNLGKDIKVEYEPVD